MTRAAPLEIFLNLSQRLPGCAYPAGTNAGSFDPLPLAEIAIKAARTGGPIGAEVSVNAQGAGPTFATHVCDVEVDPDTGHVTIMRYTAAQGSRAVSRKGSAGR